MECDAWAATSFQPTRIVSKKKYPAVLLFDRKRSLLATWATTAGD
jgi:hypothetical protein